MNKKTRILSSILALLLLVTLVGCGTEQATKVSVVEETANAYFAELPKDNHKIGQQDFIEKVKAGEDIFILDIRQEKDYNEGHIKGAVNAPWGTAISDNLDKMPTDKPIMLYCYSGQTAGQTVALLNMAGLDAKSVNLGWNFGISKAEGFKDVVETTANEFGEAEGTVNSEIKTAIENHYKGLADVKDTMFANYKLGEDNLKKLIDEEDNSIVVVSVRSAKDFAEGHITGATNIPWGQGMQEKFSDLPKDKKVVVYCYSGQTAGQTVAGLRMLGYDAVSLNGGMGVGSNAPIGWSNKGYEVVK